MTREEAIRVLNMVEAHGLADEAKRMAIKSLEQEPCEDAISRVEALKAIEKEKQGWEGAERYAIDECHSRIAELPSVTPQLKTALDLAIKALEQEPIIDKIRAEIEQITDTMGVSYNQYVSKIDVLQIIDKYRTEVCM